MIWVVHPGYFLPILDPGPGVKKGTGIRIRNTAQEFTKMSKSQYLTVHNVQPELKEQLLEGRTQF